MTGSDHRINCFGQKSDLTVNLYHEKEINIGSFSEYFSNVYNTSPLGISFTKDNKVKYAVLMRFTIIMSLS